MQILVLARPDAGDGATCEFDIVANQLRKVPSRLRPVTEDPSNSQIFFDYYAIAKHPISKEGLLDHDNYHEYCSLLGRFKANYQEWIVECYQEKKLVAIEPYLMHVGKPWRRDQETTPLNKPRSRLKGHKTKPSIVASSESEPAEEDLSPAKVKKWAIDDLKETIAWFGKSRREGDGTGHMVVFSGLEVMENQLD
ncbi:hypothetical protein Scep_002581 [Stephania cephalantha]|uniref:BRCT domain-containing protein n=1 Tax=Stephania cephalantha TaxID=152367 RepID=A0AAP0LBA2_9MAGN